jgi:O-antigen/teichoic acid export membrane protein
MRVIPAVAYIGGLLLTIPLGVADQPHFIAANLVSLAIMLGVAIVVFWRSGGKLTRPSKAMLGRVLSFGIPTVMQRVATNCRDNFDRIALPLFVTNVALGHYVVAGSSAYIIYIAGMTVDLVGFPAMSRAPNDEARRQLAEFLISITFCALVALVIGLSLVARPLVLLLFGNEYASAIAFVPWFLVAGAAQALRIVIGGAFKSFNLTRSMMRFELMAAGIMVITLIGTGAWLGVYAGLLAHLLGALVSLGVAFYSTVSVLKLSPRHIFLPRRGELVRVYRDFKAIFRGNQLG